MSDTPYKLPWKRRVLAHPAVQSAAAWLAAQLLRLLWLSFRRDIRIHPDAAAYMRGDTSAIFCLWHGRMILFPFLKPKARELFVLISHHRDGELIAKLIAHFGVQSVRGSSSNGAKEATHMLQQKLAEGRNISITPDGPRGPACQAQRGALHLARQSGTPMIPVSFAASRYTQLRSWDRFIIPHPFAKIRVEIAAPITVAKAATLTELKQHKLQLEEALDAAAMRADEVRVA
jgi:lysophospholipid acyltransferase (LPLAT)-like uncharacterized protein